MMDKHRAAATCIHSADFDRKRYAEFMLSAYKTPTERHQDVLRQVQTNLQGYNPWHCFWGAPGAGKTHLAYGMAMELIIAHADKNNGWNDDQAYGFWRKYATGGRPEFKPLECIGCTYFQLVAKIRQDPRDWRTVRDNLLAPILFVDEIREMRLSDFEAGALDELFNLRYRRRMYTIFASNLAHEEFWVVLGHRVESRFAEVGRGNLVRMTGIHDWRARDLELDPIVKPDAARPVVRSDRNAS